MTCFFWEQISIKSKHCHCSLTLNKNTSLKQNYVFLPATFKTCKPSECVILLHTTRKETVKPCKTLRFWISCLGLPGAKQIGKSYWFPIFLGAKSCDGEETSWKAICLGKCFYLNHHSGGPFDAPQIWYHEKAYHQNISRVKSAPKTYGPTLLNQVQE